MSHNGLHVKFKESIYCIYVPYYMHKSFKMGNKKIERVNFIFRQFLSVLLTDYTKYPVI